METDDDSPNTTRPFPFLRCRKMTLVLKREREREREREDIGAMAAMHEAAGKIDVPFLDKKTKLTFTIQTNSLAFSEKYIYIFKKIHCR